MVNGKLRCCFRLRRSGLLRDKSQLIYNAELLLGVPKIVLATKIVALLFSAFFIHPIRLQSDA